MVFYGYTIGDADNPGTAAVGFDVYRYIIPNVGAATGCVDIPVELVTTLTGANFTGAAGTDLEGLGTSPRIQRISAVSEGPGTGFRVNNLDRPAAPVVQNFTGTARVFDDSGSDFYVNDAEVATQYILQGEQIAVGGFRSTLYRTGASGSIGDTTLTQVVNSDSQFADGLAIYNYPVNRKVLNGSYTGNYIAFASDFALNDGDGEQIYSVDLDGPDILGNPIQLLNPDGTDFNVLTHAAACGLADPDNPDDGFDTGLAFTPDGKRLIAQTENGLVFEITDFLDDQLGSVIGNGEATIIKLGRLTLGGVPIPGAVNGSIEYEGLAIVSEAANGNSIFTV